MDLNFWKGKKVFITGHTGFKGSWLTKILQELGATISGFSLPLGKENELYHGLKLNIESSYYGDICDLDLLQNSLNQSSPEIIFHLAAQPIVSQSYQDPIKTFETNILGTAKLLLAANNLEGIRAIINVTSDKCYANNSIQSKSFIETDPMGGNDPYSASKGCAELISAAINQSFLKDSNIGIANVRAGNVIGGGDTSKDRLFPDIVRSIYNSNKLVIRSPMSVRPWQHVLEPLFGYIELAEKITNDKDSYSGGWNFGPELEDCIPVIDVLDIVKTHVKDFSFEVLKEVRFYEATSLRLDINKSKSSLDWKPKWSCIKSIEKTLDFYNLKDQGYEINRILEKQINEYLR